MAGQNFTAFVVCDIVIYVEIKREQCTSTKECDFRSVPRLKLNAPFSEILQKSDGLHIMFMS